MEEKKKFSIKLLSAEKESSNVAVFKAKVGEKIIEDRCSISGIKNMVSKNIDHPNIEIYKLVIKSLGG